MKNYAAHKTRAAQRQRTLSTTGRDIGPIPPVADPERRTAASKSLKTFCEAYFPEIFSLPWSPDHIRVITKIETAVRYGGLFAVAMPRGSGKTSLCKAACLWGILNGHRDFIALIGASESHAQNLLHDLKLQLETNPILLADYPDVCYPIAALEGIANRCRGQLYQGRRTHIEWTATKLVLPTIPHSPASGAIVTVAGITGQIRGMSHQRPDGRIARPNLVIIDDPQTDESARSPSQCAAREAVIAGAILGLAGPRKKIAGIMPCTVIYPGDVADNLLNRAKHPEWNGERLKLLYGLPTNTDLWQQYAEIRAKALREGKGLAPATAFYKKRRKAMDAGAKPAWKERYNPDELSAIQHAMNLKLTDEAAFWSEYQNEPRPAEVATVAAVATLADRLNTLPRATVPAEAQVITAMIDLHQRILYYAVIAWTEGFTGWIIDYGAWPPQRLPYYRAENADPALATYYQGHPLESAIYHGLADLTTRLATPWPREHGPAADVDRILIDAGWGQCTDLVYTFCRESTHASRLLPSFGRYIGAASMPMDEYRRKPGERAGPKWRLPPPPPGRPTRHVLFDANYWKTFITQRLTTPRGTTGTLTIYGTNPADHRLLADHLNSETPIEVTARGRTVTEWKPKPSRPDNHLFDCLVGCAVAASIAGITDPTAPAPTPKRPLKLSELRHAHR